MADAKPRTLGELKAAGYKVRPVKDEMRRNLIEKIRREEVIFPGIIGYEDSVLPQIENAILSGQDIILLGERGQGKSRLIRSLVNLLDEETPIIAGSELFDDPYNPISKMARELVAEKGDATPIDWVHRSRRYGEKLATPDITIADLIGEVDPIKVAEGRYLSDELTIHYGLIPRTNRGIFCINELPDLAERIQVGLLNILEERDVQIRGYRIQLPLDVFFVASANPEDYTNRGRIITPLKDRCGSEIRTHYPRTNALEIEIMDQERYRFDEDEIKASSPNFMKEVVAEVTQLARRSPDINQRSGVSVRVSIANYENTISNAVKRSIRTDETTAAPRVSDLPSIVASMAGKIELEATDDGREEHVIDKLTQSAILNVFNRNASLQDLEPMVAYFDQGNSIEVSEAMRSSDYMQAAGKVPGLLEHARTLAGSDDPAVIASAIEFILEGLHLNRKLNKDKVTGRSQYRGHHGLL